LASLRRFADSADLRAAAGPLEDHAAVDLPVGGQAAPVRDAVTRFRLVEQESARGPLGRRSCMFP
jgi:hypothetical protein